MLKRFYAVTKSRSLYEISCLVEFSPSVKKIALRGESSVVIGQTLKNGTHVNVGTFGWIGLYNPSYEDGKALSADYTNTRYFGGQTSQVVGLFLNKRYAIKCIRSGDTKFLSPKWINFTRAALQKIGPNHVCFKIGMDFAHLLKK